MAHMIILDDEQYARLQAAGRLYHRSVEQVIADLLAGFPVRHSALTGEEYERQWTTFMQAVGGIQHGAPLSSEEIDELIGEEAGETHADNIGNGSDATHPGWGA